MSTLGKVVVAVIALAVAYAAGMWSAPTKEVVKTVTVTKEVIKYVEKKDSKKEKHYKTTTVKVIFPDGRIEETTTTTEDTTDSSSSSTSNSSATSGSTSSDKTTIRDAGKVTIQALSGVKVNDLSGGLLYGASVSKPVLGPITIGAWGLSNASFGVSAGLSF